jgi:spore coat protein U-like protein
MSYMPTPRFVLKSLVSSAVLLCTNPGSALAATTTSSLSVTAAVAQKCSISATSTLAFGTYDPVVTHASSALDGTGSVTVKCTKGSSGITIDLDGGANLTGTQRRLKGTTVTTEFLNYAITQPDTASPYTACPYTTTWGSTVSGSVYTPASVSWSASTGQQFTVCGRVASAQNVTAQAYTDTVTVTVNF